MIRNNLRCTAMVLLALVALLMPHAFGAASEPLPKGTLSGTVVGPDGKPIANVRVWTNTDSGKLLAEARTDTAGRFRLGPFEPEYRHRGDLLFEAAGWARQYAPGGTFSIFPGTDCDLGRIRMDRGRVFVGQVVDADGKPRSGVLVECETYRHVMGHTVSSIGTALKMETDSDGRFRTPPMSVASLSLTARAPERRLAWVNPIAKLPGGEEVLAPIRLEKDVPIPGIVRDENGKLVAGAKFLIGGLGEMITDAAGKFTVRGFGPEPGFQMIGSKDGHESINWGVSVKKDGIHWFNVYGDRKQHGPIKELIIVMKTMPKAWIEGRALDAVTGKPVHVDKVILCQLERKPDGEVERRG
jgi:hypothetical protein